ncbi:MAG TPA: hypothetical protein VGD42_03740 [Lysobacter sp.]
MAPHRTLPVPGSLILGAIGVMVIASAVLMAFPGNLLVWQVGSWTLAAALLALVALVAVCGHALATRREARTWQRMTSFAAGLVVLAALVIGSF